ncbi:HTH domain-containing protein [Streptomyces sp. NPDC088789]|uniref:HTH domain-containing protein n=1 Tax=Streptomyces sp. NPDC088789 TaxID=3365899 RepID=UPI0037F1E745
MTPSSARAMRRRRVAELRAAEPRLSFRQMAARLEISRDTVRRDLAALGLAAESAPPAGAADRPVSHTAPPAAGTDLAQRGLRRDLAALAQTGLPPGTITYRAVRAMAQHYTHALATGAVPPGVPFVVTGMTLRPAPDPGRGPAPPSTTAGCRP